MGTRANVQTILRSTGTTNSEKQGDETRTEVFREIFPRDNILAKRAHINKKERSSIHLLYREFLESFISFLLQSFLLCVSMYGFFLPPL